jgi:hypothetical protein
VAAESGCVYKLSGDILVTLAVEGYGLTFNAKNPSRDNRPLPFGRLRCQNRRSEEQDNAHHKALNRLHFSSLRPDIYTKTLWPDFVKHVERNRLLPMNQSDCQRQAKADKSPPLHSLPTFTCLEQLLADFPLKRIHPA